MKKSKILVTGLNGFLGSRFRDLAKNEFLIEGFEHRGKKSITDRQFTFDLLRQSKASIVLHLAAKTHIDSCEMDRSLGKQSLSWQVNVNGTKNIADACAEYNKHLIYLSTECVFDGSKPWYKETDKPNPLNWYGLTKLNGELALVQSDSKYCILRSTLAYGHPMLHPFDLFHFFVNKLKNNKKVNAVNDQLLSLTFIDDLINVIAVLINNRVQGIYHYAGSESVSPYQFACLIGKNFSSSRLVQPVSLAEFFGRYSILRLKNALLSSVKIKKEFNISPSDLNSSLKKLFAGL